MASIDFDFGLDEEAICDWCRRVVRNPITAFDGRRLCPIDSTGTNRECWKLGVSISRAVQHLTPSHSLDA